MAVEERVVIKVDIDADINKDLLAIEKRLKALDDRNKSLNRSTRDMDRGLDRVAKRFSRFGNVLKRVTMALGKFVMTLSKFSFIALAGQVALFATALLGVKAALITGRAAVSLYNIALKGLSVTAAAVATGLAVAASAMRQFSEVQMAANFGGGMSGRQQAGRLGRGLSTQMRGLLGGEATSAITGTLARGGIGGNQNALVRQIFNLSGGDAKAAQSLANALAGKDVGAARTAIKQSAGFRTGSLEGVSTMSGMRGVVGGGGATSAGFAGLGNDMARTFIGTLKTEFAGLTSMFADFGEPMLGPFRDAFLQIGQIIRNDLLGMMGIIQKFGADSFAPSLVTIIEKTMAFIRNNVNDHIQDVKTMGENFVGFFRAVRDFFVSIGDGLKKMEPAANVVIDMFRAMGDTAGGRGLFKSFRKLVVDNAEGFKEFGASIGRVFGGLFDLLSGGQSGFFANIGRVSETLNRIGEELIPALGKILNAITPVLEQLPNVVSALADGLTMLAPVVSVLAETLAGVLAFISMGGGMGGIGLLGAGLMFTGGPGGKSGFKAMAGRGRGAMAFARAAGGFAMSGGLLGSARSAPKGAGMKGMFKGGGPAAMMGLAGLGIGAGGVLSSYQSGGGASGMLTGMAGGAMTGFAVGGPVGAAVGAAVGAIASGIAGFIGRNKIKKATEKALDKHLDTLANVGLDMTTGIGDTRSELEALTNQRSTLGAAVTAGGKRKFTEEEIKRRTRFTHNKSRAEKLRAETVGRDTEEFKAATDMLQELGIIGEKFDKDTVFDRLPELLDEADGAIERLETRIENFDSQVAHLSETFNISADSVTRMADALGINLQESLNALGLELIFQSQLNPMNRNQGFLPDLSTSMLGQNERRDSASAALQALQFAAPGEVTTSMISDAISSMAAYEVSTGMSADLGALSGIFEIEENLDALSGGDVAKQSLIQGTINTAKANYFGQMGAEYGVDASTLRGVYEGAGGGEAGIAAIDESLTSRQGLMTAMSRRSGDFFTDADAFNQYIDGGDITQNETFQKAFKNNMVSSGVDMRMLGGVDRQMQAGEFDMEYIKNIAATGGFGEDFDLNQVMTDFITMDAPSDVARNDLLSQINDGIQNLELVVPSNDERAPVDVPGFSREPGSRASSYYTSGYGI